jgi:hypothetical protein
MHLCTCVSEEGGDGESVIVVYYKSRKRELNSKLMKESFEQVKKKTVPLTLNLFFSLK